MITNNFVQVSIDCYVVTEQHIANVKEMDDIGKVHNYRYDLGYPEKLKFDV